MNPNNSQNSDSSPELSEATGSAGSMLCSAFAWYASLPQPEKDKITNEAKDIVRRADASAKATIAILNGKASHFLPNNKASNGGNAAQ